MSNTQIEIANACDAIKKLLLDKNKKYGDSALSPTRIFSKASAVDQILVRIDDKLSRISKGAGLLASDEDVINDLIGYLILLKIATNRNSAPILDPYSEGSSTLDQLVYGFNVVCPVQEPDTIDFIGQAEWDSK